MFIWEPLLAKHRVMCSICPECKSEEPAIDHCEICREGDKFNHPIAQRYPWGPLQKTMTYSHWLKRHGVDDMFPYHF